MPTTYKLNNIPEAEYEAMRVAAAKNGQSINQWILGVVRADAGFRRELDAAAKADDDTKYYAVHDETAIYGVGTADPDTMRDDTAREAGYDSHAAMVAEGNRGFDVSRILPELAREILAHGFSGGAFTTTNGVIVRLG